MKRFFKTKKGLALLAVLAALAAAIGAYAYFTSTGSGTGSAKTAGAPASLTITQVGAGYNSLVPSSTYHQDQCFQCAQISKFGNDITLANPGAQRLVSVVVAFRNWGAAFNGVPITLGINNTTSGPISAVATPSFPAASGGHPSTTNVTFDFSSQGAFVQQEFVYGISFDSSSPADGLNVALSSSANNLAVGTDTAPGTVFVDTAAGPGIDGDFPTCTIPGVGFAQVTTNCGPSAAGNPGAYGTPAQVAAGSADIPAVQVNVVGGIVTGLTPGGPSQPIDFAITNPGSSGVHVSTVSTIASSLSGAGSDNSIEACATSMYPIAGSPATVNAIVAPGTTVFSPSGTSISMTDDGNIQNNCEGATVNLTFSSN